MPALFTARTPRAEGPRSRLLRSLLAALLLAASTVAVGAFASPPASAAPNPVTCEGYPEERVYLESHAWWQPVLNGDEDFGHLHTETCFPRTHDRDGNVQQVTGTLQLDVRVVMHSNPGTLDWLRVQVSGDGFNEVGFHQDMNATCTGANDPDWDAHMGACIWWVKADVDTTVAGADGFNELRVSAKVEEPNGDEMRNSTGWQAYLANGRGVDHYRSDTGAFTEGRGWYEGAGYAVGRLVGPVPHEVSGTWTPNVVVDAGSGGVDVGRSRVMVDPRFHHGDEGWKVVDQAGPYRGQVSIDTTKLADGRHRLYIQALAPCDGSEGNDCGTKSDGSDNNVSTNAGAQVIPFVVNNGGGAPTTVEPTHQSGPEPASATDADRIAGADRMATAVKASQDDWPDGANVAVVARADRYPDALTGGPLAKAAKGPILLTQSDVLTPVVAAELERLAPSMVYVLGGETAINADVEAAIEATVPDVERLGGVDRFATAVEVMRELESVGEGDLTRAFVVEGVDPDPNRGWPDAVAVSALAAWQGSPILLVATELVPDTTAAALDGMDATIVGGPVAIDPATRTRIGELAEDVDEIAGDNRYHTSQLIAEAGLPLMLRGTQLTLVSGGNWPDALVAGPVAAGNPQGPMMLVHPTDLAGSPETVAFIEDQGPFPNVDLFGGPAAINTTVEAGIAATNQ